MSTLDVVNQCGGSAANFLDIGGGANADVMAAALEVINSDPAVRSIFVNIFGGITRVDEVAKGVLEALERVEIRSPIVLRLDGTNAVAGREILADHLSDRSGRRADHALMPHAVRGVALAGGKSWRASSSTRTPRSWSRASAPPVKVSTMGSATGTTAPRSWLARTRTGVARKIDGIAVYATVAEAVEATGASASFISVPAQFAAAAIVEAAAAGVPFVVCITEGIPASDEALAYNRLARDFPGTQLLGPNTGIHLPGKVQHQDHLRGHRPARRSGRHRQPPRAPSPTRRSTSSASKASARPPASGSEATPSPARPSSTVWRGFLERRRRYQGDHDTIAARSVDLAEEERPLSSSLRP